jgi:hypothetical protein
MAPMNTAVTRRGSLVAVILAGMLASGCGPAAPAPAAAPQTGSASASAGDVPTPGAVLGPGLSSGAGPAEHAQAATMETCKLLTRDDIEKALHQTFQDAEPTLDGNSSVISGVTRVNNGCTYFATERRKGGVGEVDLDLARLPDAAATYAELRGRYTAISGFTDVAGVGDAAFRSGDMLMVRKGGTILDLGVDEVDDAVALARLTTIARIVLPRI